MIAKQLSLISFVFRSQTLLLMLLLILRWATCVHLTITSSVDVVPCIHLDVFQQYFDCMGVVMVPSRDRQGDIPLSSSTTLCIRGLSGPTLRPTSDGCPRTPVVSW